MAGKADALYAACDRAIKAMNRENLKSFGKLKLAKWDELNVIREVTEMYRKSVVSARKRYYEIAFEVYVLILLWEGTEPKKAHEMAEKAIDEKWVDGILKEPDLVTLYSFDSETERKAQRLIEALSAAQNKDQEIDRALKLWIRQLGQYAINFTDYAAAQAYEDAGVDDVRWVTQHDERVCPECGLLDGKVFKLDAVPLKHWGCRCYLVSAKKAD